MRKLLRKILLPLVLAAILLVNIAATGSSQANAIAIASVVGLALPFLYKVFPVAGHYMVIITVVVSVICAVVAEVAGGEIKLSNFQGTLDTTHLYLIVMSVYGLSQFMFAFLTQSPKTAKAVV
jgi:hypothetical protein